MVIVKEAEGMHGQGTRIPVPVYACHKNMASCNKTMACVASVSVGLGNKESQRNGIFGILPARKIVREPNRGKRGRGGEVGFPSFPSPTPFFPFLALATFFAREKHRKMRTKSPAQRRTTTCTRFSRERYESGTAWPMKQ